MIHPFRDGNGRAQRILFEHLIINAGYEISWWPVEEGEWLRANIEAVFCDYDALVRIFERCIGRSIA
ncbi:putative adenosine monophosphate-protein transferase fic [compost metagenome]